MPRIFDNIGKSLLPALTETLQLSSKAVFCVGYFNLRGWKQIDTHIESMAGGEDNCCRLLVGMQRLPQDELRQALSFSDKKDLMDNQTALRLKKRLAELSKAIIDEIDTVIANHYNFSNEGLNFIINYDIKYRMGIR
jgi:hypothetical protein